MRDEITRAIEVADAYRNDHEGEIPVLVIAHSEDGSENVFIGAFRTHKNHIHEDQKMFCSVMRMAFAIHNVKSYELVVKPQFNYALKNMTLNVLAVVAVNETEKNVQWFEIEDDALTPHFSDEPMPVEGMFTQLLPTQAEREYGYTPKTVSGINSYLANCRYNVKQVDAAVATVMAKEEAKVATGMDAMLEAFA